MPGRIFLQSTRMLSSSLVFAKTLAELSRFGFQGPKQRLNLGFQMIGACAPYLKFSRRRGPLNLGYQPQFPNTIPRVPCFRAPREATICISSRSADKPLELKAQVWPNECFGFRKVDKFKTLAELYFFGHSPKAKTLEPKCLNLSPEGCCT